MVLSNTAIPNEYAKFRTQVLNGEIPVNEYVALQMNRIDELISSPEFYYDDKAIDGFVRFCEAEMTLADGGDLKLLPTFKLWAEDALSWFYFIEERVYNPKMHRYEMQTKLKRLRNVQYLIVARGAAKSMYAALMQAYHLVVDTTTTHQVVTAPTMKQSEETMMPIRTAIARSRGPLFTFLTQGSILSNTHTKTKLASTKKGVENFMTNSLLEIRTMSVDKLQGLGIKFGSVDEWLSGRVKENVIDTLEQGASKIDDYMILATSSEGVERDGVGDSIKMDLINILNGKYRDDSVSIWYYRLDDISEVDQPEMWLKANPNLGATVSYETYEKQVIKAEENPSLRSDIIAKRFGIPLEGASYYFTYEETIPHPHKTYTGMPCVMGADLSQGDDFCAFTFLFPIGGGRYGIKVRSYVSALKVMKLPTATRMKYREFEMEGSLIIMDDPVLDMLRVYDDLDEFIMANQYAVLGVGYDPYNADEFMDRWVVEHGAYGITKVRQGVRTESVPLGEIKLMMKHRMLLFDEILMKFSVGNSVVIEDNNGNRKLSKKRAEEKIDNVSALMDAWVAYKKIQEAFM